MPDANRGSRDDEDESLSRLFWIKVILADLALIIVWVVAVLIADTLINHVDAWLGGGATILIIRGVVFVLELVVAVAILQLAWTDLYRLNIEARSDRLRRLRRYQESERSVMPPERQVGSTDKEADS